MRPPISRRRNAGRLAAVAGAGLLLAGCGAGGVVTSGDKDHGKKLFVQKCGGCHTLAAAGTSGQVGPNLDDSFASARASKFSDSSIADIVAGQIRAPGQYGTGTAQDKLSANMPADLVKGQDLKDVAEFVAANAGSQGFAEATAVTGTNGKAIFKTKCGGCHTLAAAGTNGTQGPNLDQLKPPYPVARAQVEHGGGIMPAFRSQLTEAQISAVARFVAQNAGK